jgi:hypothetical protein
VGYRPFWQKRKATARLFAFDELQALQLDRTAHAVSFGAISVRKHELTA